MLRLAAMRARASVCSPNAAVNGMSSLKKNTFKRSFVVGVSRYGGGSGHSQQHTQSKHKNVKEIAVEDSLEGLSVETISALTGVPEDVIASRTIEIFRPTRNTMQSGNGEQNRQWVLKFIENDETQRHSTLMGWAGSKNPLGSVQLTFPSQEAAVRAAKRLGFSYEVIPDPSEDGADQQPKSYSANFQYKPKNDDIDW